MRKKSIKFLSDTIFWYLIYSLPLVAYLLYLFAEPASGTSIVSFSAFFESVGIGFVSDNIVVNALKQLFGAGGIMPLFATDTPFILFAWFICTFIAHLAVDFLLFIPRLCHKFFDKFYQGD